MILTIRHFAAKKVIDMKNKPEMKLTRRGLLAASAAS